ncbi:MAG: DUF2071 domain-containing protein [Verrucomicrobiota bacterium]|nr:DUF2071 domain-containing protein [Verrucomicrobiota bacterium]
MPRVFLTAEWRSLVVLNYRIDPHVLQAFVPRGTELDLWQEEAVVSVLGFLFLQTRVLGLRVPFHQDFEEVNLRFYVKREAADGVRRGVVFIKEIVPKPAIAITARLFYNEPYVAMPMSHEAPPGGAAGDLSFRWRHRGRWHSIAARTRGEPGPMPPGSEQEFIFEHYWGYSRQRDGGTVEYQVEHPRWRVWPVENATFECDVASIYGSPFVNALSLPPRSAFVAEGSAVQVRSGTRI